MRTLIAASHGTDNFDGQMAISSFVTKLQLALSDSAVTEAFVDVQQPDVPAVLAKAGNDVVVVPLLLATGYHVRQDIADACFEALPDKASVVISPALGPDQRLVDVLIQRLDEAGATAESAANDLIVLTVAGSSDARAQAETDRVKSMLEAALSNRNGVNTKVELAFLSAAEPKLKDLVPKLKFKQPGKRIVISSYLLAPGYFSGLLERVGAHVVTRPLLSPELETPIQMIEVAKERFEQAAARSGQTGCLDGLVGREFAGCAAGCATSCRSLSN